MGEHRGGITVLLLPDEAREPKSFRVSRTALVIGTASIVIGCILVAVMASSWWFMALEAGKGWRLASAVDSLRSEQARIHALAEDLALIEARYEGLRSLFGPDSTRVAPDLWLPPTGLPGARSIRGENPGQDHLPTAWPLSESGFVTRALVEGAQGDHPGIDIAVPTDSYVRAAGSGRVLRTGEDPLYGLFVVLEHRDGYQTVYGHLSTLLVDRGQTVQKAEVIALSGSTGRSTAAHLHFEILLEGAPLDPLTMVEQPR